MLCYTNGYYWAFEQRYMYQSKSCPSKASKLDFSLSKYVKSSQMDEQLSKARIEIVGQMWDLKSVQL